MKFFIDTANLDQIREANAMGVLDGVTTNPSLMAKEGIKGVENQRQHYIDICNIVNGDVSAEVIATDYEGMIKEGEELAALNPHIVVKIPCIADGIKAIKYLQRKAYAPTARWCSPPDKLSLLPRPEQRMSLRLSDVWTTSAKTVWLSSPKSWTSTVHTDSRRKCWLHPSATHATSSLVPKWELT